MTRTKLVEDLKGYFASKGKFLTYNEYLEAEDAPYRPQLVKRMVGSWARLQRMVDMVEAPVAIETPVAVEAPVVEVEATVEPEAPAAKPAPTTKKK